MKLLNIAQVSDMLGIPVRTLRLWRMKGEGPRAALIGKHLRYRLDEVERWIRERELEPVGRGR